MAKTLDDQLSRFIKRGRRKNPANNGYKPAKRGTLPASYRPVKRGTKAY